MTSIQLTYGESQLFNLLKDVARANKLDDLIIRVAGGWVRDKLLGLPNKDIDIALNTLSGESFALLIEDYIQTTNLRELYFLDSLDATEDFFRISQFGVIKSNPEASKHLSTATMKIFDFGVDFSNLRSETYATNVDHLNKSRIPQIEMGTPQEDAFRRDLTINTLFYNVTDDLIEDLTGKGLSDLQEGVIRTPLDPLQTFLDDPLRILRTIRFSSRLSFSIVDDIYHVCQSSSDIHHALRTKVSRERVFVEIKSILTGNHPTSAMKTLLNMGREIYDIIFDFPPDMYPQRLRTEGDREQGIRYMESMETLLSESERKPNPYYCWLLYLASMLYPYFSYTIQVQEKTRKKTFKIIQTSMTYYILKSLKCPKKDSDGILLMGTLGPAFVDFLPPTGDPVESPEKRKEVGNLIRKAGPLWESILLLMSVVISDTRLLQLINIIYSWHLDCCYSLTPLFNGKEVGDLYSLRPGSWLDHALTEQINIQLARKHVNKDEMKQILLEKKDQFLPTLKKQKTG